MGNYFGSALQVTVNMLPVLGLLMIGLHQYAAWTNRYMMKLAFRWAALVYVGLLYAGLAIVWNIGALPAQALFYPELSPWRIGIGLVLAVPFAVAPYWLELAVSRALRNRSRLAAEGLDYARQSATALATGRVRFALVAVATAVVEEALFRGAVLFEVTNSRGPLLALLAVGVIFGLHHMAFGLPAIAGKLLAGLLWGMLMLSTGVVLVPLVSHLLFQLLVYRRMAQVRERAAQAADSAEADDPRSRLEEQTA
jgi:membrane protease YdiL (CAAX protease family)